MTRQVDSQIPYVYILGASHSGSTLLTLLLNTHRDVGTIGQTAPGGMGDPETYRCSCQALIRHCPFWKQITREIAEDHPGFGVGGFGTTFDKASNSLVRRVLRAEHRGPLLEACRDIVLRLSPSWRRQFDRTSANCVALARAVLRTKGARVFLDSSKVAHHLKFLLRIPSLYIRVIHLVRDGRAVSLTYMDQATFADSADPELRLGGRGRGVSSPPAGLPMERAADEWRRCIRSAEFLLRRLPRDRWIQVHYEELCRQPRATVARICEFIGLDSRSIAADFRAVEHHIVGNGMRLDSASEVRLDERWRAVLTEDDLHVFQAVAGNLNRRYGYV